MTERDDPGKALLRMLHAGQTPAPPAPTSHHHQPFQSTQQQHRLQPHQHQSPPHPILLQHPALPAADVRDATSGRGDYSTGPAPGVRLDHGYFLPRPGASVAPTTNTTPSRSAGADLLRMLQQGGNSSVSPRPSAPASQHQNQHQHYHQHQQQYASLPVQLPPPPLPQQQQQQQQHQPHSTPTPRSIAAQQERLLKTFLSIGDNSNTNDSTSRAPPTAPVSATTAVAAPSSMLLTNPVTPPATPKSQEISPPPRSATNGGGSGGAGAGAGGKGKNKPGGGKDRGRGRENGPGRQQSGGSGGGGSGGGSTPVKGTDGRVRGQDGGGRGSGGPGGREAGRGDSKRGGRGGGRGGGGRDGDKKNSTPKRQTPYAWSAFQNSPDPKSIPIPSLRHFSLHEGPEDGGTGGGGVERAERSEPSDWRSGAAGGTSAADATNSSQADRGEGGSKAGVAVAGAVVEQGKLTQTPSPPSRPAMNRSSAKKAEDDIKRMLRLG